MTPILRPYQQRAVAYLQGKKRAFVISVAGSGKTLIAAGALAQSLAGFAGPWRIGWIANTREQVQQAQDAAAKFGLTIDAHCAAAQPDCSQYDILIVDEAHHMPAATWSATVAKAQNIVWGFSATPWSTDPIRNDLLREFFKEFHTVPREEVLAHGSITKGIVFVHDVDHPGQFDFDIEQQTITETARRCRRFPWVAREEHERRARWQATADTVRLNTNRNEAIVHLATHEPGSVLVLVGTVEHGEELQQRIPGSAVVHAKIGKKKRAALIGQFRSGELRCMIATSLADEGLDVPRASVLVLAAGGRSAAKLEQRAGRVMRPHEDKEFGTVHDFSDRGAALAYAQHLARLKTYKKLGYQITRPANSRAA